MLIAGVLRDRNVEADVMPGTVGGCDSGKNRSDQLRDAAKSLRDFADQRAVQDWTIDIIVERMLEELTW